jgi:hypothetical protein
MLSHPDIDLISTSHAERQNSNVRLFNHRFTRLTLGYSKKLSIFAIRLPCSVLLELVLGAHDGQTRRRHRR